MGIARNIVRGLRPLTLFLNALTSFAYYQRLMLLFCWLAVQDQTNQRLILFQYLPHNRLYEDYCLLVPIFLLNEFKMIECLENSKC